MVFTFRPKLKRPELLSVPIVLTNEDVTVPRTLLARERAEGVSDNIDTGGVDKQRLRDVQILGPELIRPEPVAVMVELHEVAVSAASQELFPRQGTFCNTRNVDPGFVGCQHARFVTLRGAELPSPEHVAVEVVFTNKAVGISKAFLAGKRTGRVAADIQERTLNANRQRQVTLRRTELTAPHFFSVGIDLAKERVARPGWPFSLLTRQRTVRPTTDVDAGGVGEDRTRPVILDSAILNSPHFPAVGVVFL